MFSNRDPIRLVNITAFSYFVMTIWLFWGIEANQRGFEENDGYKKCCNGIAD